MKASVLAFFMSAILIAIAPIAGQTSSLFAGFFLLLGSIGVFLSVVGFVFSIMFWSIKRA